MSLLSKLFGGGGGNTSPSVQSEAYDGFTITPNPERMGTNWRIGATIEKDGKTHNLIRADQLSDKTEAEVASVRKAKQMIDEQGERIFG